MRSALVGQVPHCCYFCDVFQGYIVTFGLSYGLNFFDITYGAVMQTLLYTSVVLTLINVYLIIYIGTLHLYPKAWSEKTNSNPRSLNPRVNNQTCVGITVTITALLMCFSWGIYFYYLIF